MSEQITLEVSEQVIRQAALIAAQKRGRVEDVLSDWLESAATELPVESLPDEQVLALADLQLTAAEQSELSELLGRNREADIDAPGRRRLDELMGVYERGLLRKAQALRVAVERGLREPLQS
jgi:hypothetical protein